MSHGVRTTMSVYHVDQYNMIVLISIIISFLKTYTLTNKIFLHTTNIKSKLNNSKVVITVKQVTKLNNISISYVQNT